VLKWIGKRLTEYSGDIMRLDSKRNFLLARTTEILNKGFFIDFGKDIIENGLISMIGNEINLQQMLARREARADEQKKFLEKYHAPLISFSMNIPGPIKTNHKIRAAFDEGRNLIFEALKNIGAAVNEFIETHEDIGDEILISVNNIKSPEELKNLAIKIENENKFGRLFDIDVINSGGEKLSREKFRKCLICDKQAQDCARSRAHTVKEMQDAVEKLLA